MSNPLSSRDTSVDLLRFLGISMILLAHIVPPNGVFQLRSFDVPLMIFVSGLSYSGRGITGYGRFVWKRLKRLLAPLYLFLVLYLLVVYGLSQAGLADWFPDRKIVGTFLLRLNPSIGYVWIFRVFLIVMLMTPPLIRLERAVRRDSTFIGLIAVSFALQCLLVAWFKPLKMGFWVDDYLLYAVGYSILFLLGLRMRYADCRRRILFGALFAATMVCAAFAMQRAEGTWLRMQPYKYPPQFYFLLWGSAVSVVLWCVKDHWNRLLAWRPLLFVGRNTIWIYLWHIPFVKPVKTVFADSGWVVRFLVIYAIAVGIYLLQYHLVGAIEKRTGAKLTYLKG